MIKTKQQKIRESIEHAFNQYDAYQINQLYSYTEKLSFSIDAVRAFANLKEYKGSRFFWTSPEDNITMLGFGESYRLQGMTNEEVDKEWKEILENSIIENPFPIPGTGPLLMGGFAFDPEEKSELWKSFQNSKMSIPKFLLLLVGEEVYFTINLLLEEDLDITRVIDEYESIKVTITEKYGDMKESKLIGKYDVEVEAWKNTIDKATKTIKQGELSKVVLARELKVIYDNDIVIPNVLNNLLEQQSQSYIFAIESEEDCFIGASPERLVKVENDRLLTTCLAGTAPRGETLIEDEQIGADLLHDQKNLEEHAYVVNMIMSAIESCSDNIEAPNSPSLYKLKNLQHLYTPVKAELSLGYTILDVVKRLHPTPAMGGVPREKALQFISEKEHLERGWYAAPIGWMDANGNGEYIVGIRSGLVNGNKASLFAGCGIVKDSDPESELAETKMKFKPMLMALGGKS